MMILSLLVYSCTQGGDDPEPSPEPPVEIPEEDNDSNNDQDEGDPEGTGKDDDQDTSDSDQSGDALDESEFDKVIDIVWSGASVTVTNGSKLPHAVSGADVILGTPEGEGKKVRINLNGSTDNGSLKIYNGVKANDTNKKMLLSFNGVSLKSASGPAVNIQSGKTVYVKLSDGTENYLSDAASYTVDTETEDAKGCFFSEKNLVFSGNGKLVVSGNFKHAFCVDDYIHIISGEIIVDKALSDGIHTNDYIRIDGGSLKVTSSGEALCCEKEETGYYFQTGGNVNLVTFGEKKGAIETFADIVIEGGELVANVSGPASKCLKSENNIKISGGTVSLTATGTGVYDSVARDASASACIRAENIVNLCGGNITCTSTGNGGKGINCYQFVASGGAVVNISTSGSTYRYNTYTCRPKAIKATNGVKIDGGEFDIKTTGSEGEGIESKTSVEINGGSIVLQTKDDAVNAAQTITVNGGFIYAYSTSNDAFDSNYGRSGSIVINDGVVITHAAGGAEEGFDADSHSNLTFNGGYVFCTGGQQGGGGGGGWRPGGGGGSTGGNNPSCTQPTLYWNKSVSSGYFTIADSSMNVVMSCYIPRSLSTNYSLISAPLKPGQTYKYGVVTSSPQGAETIFGKYFYKSGTVSSLPYSVTVNGGYQTIQ